MKKGLRIFSYLPNPRVWKAEIAAKIAGIKVEVIGDKPSEIPNWLWDSEPKKLSDFDILSMGMSNDYEIALDAGSNMIRIGSKIFGSRNYH